MSDHQDSDPATKPAPRIGDKKFFAALDGLRGIAAIVVVFFHLNNWTDTHVFFPRGDLAVDFFFCLSGFVMAHAYGKKMGVTMGFPQFALTRLIRLYPLMALSVIVAAVFFLSKNILTSEYIPVSDILISGLTGLFVLPYFNGSGMLGGVYEVFPINGPLWSLFYELLINFVWAVAFAFLTFRRTLGFAIVCAVLLLIGGFLNNDLLLGDRTTDFLWGVPRVGVSFAIGLLAYELHKRQVLQRTVPFWVIALALIIPMAVPRFGGGVLFDAFFIYILTPLIVLLGANIEQKGNALQASRIGGELSYPIYVLHFPLFVWINGLVQFIGVNLPIWFILTLYAVFIVCGSWLALIWFDRPVRRLLGKHQKKLTWSFTGQVSSAGKPRKKPAKLSEPVTPKAND